MKLQNLLKYFYKGFYLLLLLVFVTIETAIFVYVILVIKYEPLHYMNISNPKRKTVACCETLVTCVNSVQNDLIKLTTLILKHLGKQDAYNYLYFQLVGGSIIHGKNCSLV